MSSPKNPITIGCKVTVKGKSKGVVRYIGPTKFGAGIWVGVELDKPKGQHDGFYDGQRYFTCKPMHGVYAISADVQPLKPWQSAVRVIQGLVRGKAEKQVTDHKKTFLAWNALELDEEAQHHEQCATQERVEAILRASHPSIAQLPNEISALTLANACGMSPDFMQWGSDIEVEADYEGPHIQFPITPQGAATLLHHIRSNPDYPVHKKYVAQLLGRICQHLMDDKVGAVNHIEVPPKGKLVVFGDTHGQLADFLLVLQRHGPPSDKVAYLLNGDIADRGDNSLEIFVVILVYKLLYPNRVFINRGNHENHDINRKPADCGGGFYDEIMYKLDGSIFLMFQQFFELLPLTTIINKQVCVLHGGIPRVEGLTLNRVNSIVRRRQCPKIVQTIDDAILFDLMWADPQEAKGIAMAAQRGPNCRKFGPDITKRFLADNSLSLCIRSHEVPISLRGFEERHEGRLLTVFSASNYCGQAGNYGAIVVFDDEMSYTLEEHMAPDLDAMILEYNKTATIPPIAPNPLIQRKNSERDRPQSLAQSRELMNHEVISKLEVKICQYKDELWWYWKRIDENGTGMIPAAKWREGMTNTLKLEIPWFSLQNELARPNQNGEVDYRDFLNRIRNKAIMTGLKKVDNSWEKQILVTLYESILMADLTLKQTLAEFDPDGDGVVSPWEFKQALEKAKVDIPDGQLTALMRLIEKDGGKLDVGTFLDRFQLVYSRAADEGLENTNVGNGERARDLLTRVGRHLLQNREKNRMSIFEEADIDGDGFVQEGEFYKMIDKLNLVPPISMEEKREMYRYVDVNGDGHLNYLEFCAAFKVVGMDNEDEAISAIVETIVSALQKNMQSLEFAFRFFDRKELGHIPVDDFKAGIRALNASIKAMGKSGPLTEDQIDVLVKYVDTDGDGKVDYQEFLSAFKPKDNRFAPITK